MSRRFGSIVSHTAPTVRMTPSAAADGTRMTPVPHRRVLAQTLSILVEDHKVELTTIAWMLSHTGVGGVFGAIVNTTPEAIVTGGLIGMLASIGTGVVMMAGMNAYDKACRDLGIK